MTLYVVPTGNCNLKCTYCYQESVREGGGFLPKYDLDKMLAKTNGKFTVFGGEPLLTPIDDLEKIFKYGYEKYGSNGIQTNGSLITDRHIALFIRYRVSVGISIDGPGSLNDARRVGNLESTRKATNHTQMAIETLISKRIIPGIISTIHRINYSRIDTFLEWLIHLEKIGISSMRLHLLENDNDSSHLRLDANEEFDFLRRVYEARTGISITIFEDIQKLLLGDEKNVTCTFTGCDPYTTSAVQAIDGDGTLSNCGRVNKGSINWRKADTPGNERVFALFNTPQEFGGCQGCRFFFACKGECPGESKDWRNRTDHCETLKLLFGYFEQLLSENGKKPISLDPIRRMEATQRLLGRSYYNQTDHVDSPHEDVWHFMAPVIVK